MLVSKTDKNYITRSDMPNTNWTDEDYYVLDDNSELAKRIIEYYPRYELTTSGDRITDVTYIEKTQEELDEERIAQIHKELEELDGIISRGLEDLYEMTHNTPYPRLQEAIDTKKDLREELEQLGGE